MVEKQGWQEDRHRHFVCECGPITYLDDPTLFPRMKLYQTIRKIHLFVTLVLATFIFMYFATGFIMIYEETFQRKNISVEKVRQRIDGIRSIAPDSLVEWLREKYNLHGRASFDENTDRVKVDFSHPGTVATVRVPRSSDSVFVEVKKGDLNTLLHHYHRLHGYRGGLNYFAWAFVYDLSAASMIVFSITGFYLWYKTERKRLPGWLVFAASTLLTFSTIVYLTFF